VYVRRQQVADAAFFLGSSLEQQGKYSDAAEAYRKCLEIRSGDTMVMNKVGLSLLSAGDFQAAEHFLRLSLQIREKAKPRNDLAVAVGENDLALFFAIKDDYQDAEPLIRESLEIRRKELPQNDPAIGRSLNALGTIMERKKDFAAAGSLFEQAIQIGRSWIPNDDLDLALYLENLATLLQAEGDYDRAGPLYRQALQLQEGALGPNHPAVAESKGNLASLDRRMGLFSAAEALDREALAIDDVAPDNGNLAVAFDLNNLAVDLEREGEIKAAQGKVADAEYHEARALAQRALAIDEKAFGEANVALGPDLYNLAVALDYEGKCDEAEIDYRRTLQINVIAFGEHDPQTSSIRDKLAKLLALRDSVHCHPVPRAK
jgi:tetratricopeptide (TPR) repeat protein